MARPPSVDASTVRDERVDELISRQRRFRIVRKLGAGAMGVVFHAQDSERAGQDVALKLLKRFDAAALLRFKREFRTLSDVVHPNLVSLYELLSADDRWMFTMELVDGVEFMSHVRIHDPEPAQSGATVRSSEVTATLQTLEVSGDVGDSKSSVVRCAAYDEIERLRAALPQLVDAVRAIHRTGKLHRDLKPSNVMVDSHGRVVVLDFGVAVGLVGTDATVSDGIVGTPAYMSPEQAVAGPVSPASDWYSVGVMIYEALSGRRPFEGDALRILADKAHASPPPIHTLVPDAPSDLLELCAKLLDVDPTRRPDGAEVQATVAPPSARRRRMSTASVFAGEDDTLLVGRERELRTMLDTVAAVEEGAARILHVRGPSGMGKSALVEGLLHSLERRDDVVVLRGRCYERESVPYKALDNLIDAVTAHLSVLDEDEVMGLVPLEMTALVRLFPVLRRVDAVLGSLCLDAVLGDAGPGGASDLVGLRRRAFAALRELIGALAERRTLVLYIDDLQWGDADSAELLADVFREPDAPPALLILAYRPEEETSPFLSTFLASQSAPVRISVGKLPPAPAREMAAELLSRAGTMSPALAESIARESGGSPFFVGELTRYALAQGMADHAPEESWDVSLEQVIFDRIDALPEQSQHVLELVAVAARPLSQAIALAGAGLSPKEAPLFARLRTDHLVRTRGVGADSEVETAHDRIRETIFARLGAEARRRYHACIARELEGAAHADPEAIAVHLEAAGQLERVGAHLVAAAEQAAEALAFDRAAALYQRALDLTGPEDPDRRQLWVRLGETLGYAGRSAAAADAYLAAAALGDQGAHDLRKLAAEHLLYSGEIERGIGVLHGVLADVGIALRKSPRIVLLAMLARRARLALYRGRYQINPRKVTEVERKSLDACWSATIGFSLVDNVRGVDFGARYLLAALRSGDASHIARGLSMDACFVSFSGGRADRRARAMAARAIEIAEENDEPGLLPWAHSAAGFVRYQGGAWQEALAPIRRGIQLFMKYRTGFAWELNSTRAFETWTLFYLGDIHEMGERVSWMLRDAQDRGDLHTAANMSTGLPSVTLLARDQAKKLRRQASEAMRRWTPKGVHIQHAWECFGIVMADLYEGETARAVERVNSDWGRLKGAMLLRIQMLRAEMLTLRATANLMHATNGGEAKRHLRAAARDATKLRRGHVIGYHHIGAALAAGVAAARGQPHEAHKLLTEAIAGFEDGGMKMHVACARMRLAELMGEQASDADLKDAAAWMSEQGVVAPQRFAAVIVPGPFAAVPAVSARLGPGPE